MKLLTSRFGDMSLGAHTSRHIDAWSVEMRDAGHSPAYIKRVAGVLSAAYTTAARWELRHANPVRNAQLPKVGATKVKSPTPDTVKRALAAAKATGSVLMFLRIDAITGARRSEILGLTRDDFDPDPLTITTRRVDVPAKGGATVVERTKTARGSRIVSIDPETVRLIEKRLAEHDSLWLFPGRDPSMPMHPTNDLAADQSTRRRARGTAPS